MASTFNLREAAWMLLAAVALLLWHGGVRAGCEIDFVDSMYFEEVAFDPEESNPGAGPPRQPLAAEKPRGGGSQACAACACRRIARNALRVPLQGAASADLAWLRYCARSRRLLE